MKRKLDFTTIALIRVGKYENRLSVLAVLLGALSFLPVMNAAELISNGGFETGTFASWTTNVQAGGSGGWFIQTGTGSPLNGFTVPAPPEGNFASMTDQSNLSSHVLIQDFTVPLGATSVILSFQLFYSNQAGDFSTPNSLDFGVVPNQQFRADILALGSGDFDCCGVIYNAYRTEPGDPRVNGYNPILRNITAFVTPGSTYRLRFAEVDNQFFFAAAVDAVSINATGTAPVPEPASMFLMGAGVLAFGLRRFALARRR